MLWQQDDNFKNILHDPWHWNVHDLIGRAPQVRAWGMSMMTSTISSELCNAMTSTICSPARCGKRFWICNPDIQELFYCALLDAVLWQQVDNFSKILHDNGTSTNRPQLHTEWVKGEVNDKEEIDQNHREDQTAQ